MRYAFTGLSPEEFPTIVTDHGALVCQPGDVVDLAEPVDHPRLVAVDGSTPLVVSDPVVLPAPDQAAVDVSEPAPEPEPEPDPISASADESTTPEV